MWRRTSVGNRVAALVAMLAWLALLLYPAFSAGVATGATGDRGEGLLGAVESGVTEYWLSLHGLHQFALVAGLVVIAAVSEGLPQALCRRFGRCARGAQPMSATG